LKEFGKVGGMIDRRIGVKGQPTTSADAMLRRHIIEKLLEYHFRVLPTTILFTLLQLQRQMETLGTEAPNASDEFLNKSVGAMKASFDDELGGLSADIVDSELFAGGLLSAVKPESRRSGHDSLLEKIAATKEQRLKRVEENEEQRKKLKNADTEWSKKVRFMLEKLANLKPKNTKTAAKMENSKREVLSLLNKLSSAKTVPPTGARVETEAVKTEKLLANLESIVAHKLEFSEQSTASAQPKQTKTEDVLLRLLCRMTAYQAPAVAYIADLLSRLAPHNLTEMVRGLLLAHILLEMIQSKISPPDEKPSDRFVRMQRLKGIFVPELVQFLTRLWTTLKTSPDSPNLLQLDQPMCSVEEYVYSQLDVRVCTGQKVIQAEEESIYRLRCLHRLVCLSRTLLEAYTSIAYLPNPALQQVFSSMSACLDDVSGSNYMSLIPAGLRTSIRQLLDALHVLNSQTQPAAIVPADEVSLVLADKMATPQALQKFHPFRSVSHIVRIDARRPKKRSAKVELRQKLAKEKRGAIRELRRDARFLANYDLQKTKARYELPFEYTSDEFYPAKPEALTSLPSLFRRHLQISEVARITLYRDSAGASYRVKPDDRDFLRPFFNSQK
uniref:NOC3p domain-containing protein n=1 Tax=Schistocephalus solidus TaxID=70667 RepID=A0A183SJ03_SCHSO